MGEFVDNSLRAFRPLASTGSSVQPDIRIVLVAPNQELRCQNQGSGRAPASLVFLDNAAGMTHTELNDWATMASTARHDQVMTRCGVLAGASVCQTLVDVWRCMHHVSAPAGLCQSVCSDRDRQEFNCTGVGLPYHPYCRALCADPGRPLHL